MKKRTKYISLASADMGLYPTTFRAIVDSFTNIFYVFGHNYHAYHSFVVTVAPFDIFQISPYGTYSNNVWGVTHSFDLSESLPLMCFHITAVGQLYLSVC